MKTLKLFMLTTLFATGMIAASESAKAIECSDLGAGAELSVTINPQTKKGTVTTGETETAIRVKRLSVGGSLYSFTYRFEGRRFSLNVTDEQIDENDTRVRATLTDLNTDQRIFMGCEL